MVLSYKDREGMQKATHIHRRKLKNNVDTKHMTYGQKENGEIKMRHSTVNIPWVEELGLAFSLEWFAFHSSVPPP